MKDPNYTVGKGLTLCILCEVFTGVEKTVFEFAAEKT